MFEKLSESLVPIRKMNPVGIYNVLRHPVTYKKLVYDKRMCRIVLMNPPHKLEVIGAIEFSNIVFNPDIGKGWFVDDEAVWEMDNVKAYICHPNIPFALGLNEKSFHAQARISSKLKVALGLPNDWIQLQPEMLCNMAMTKWNQAFEEYRANVWLVIFGIGIGMALATLLILALFFLIGVVS
jgi:hypothetical protein